MKTVLAICRSAETDVTSLDSFLSACLEYAAQLGARTVVAIRWQEWEQPNVAEFCQWADEVWVAVPGDSAVDTDPEHWVGWASDVVATTGADVIFFPHSPLNVQIAARLASRVGAILATDCIAVSIADGELRGAVRPVYGSKVLATFAGGYPMVLTVRSGRHVSQPRAPKKSPPAVREVGLAGRAVRARLLERRFLGGDEGANLHSARIVVGVGRGVGGPEGVALVREQARRIDAAVAASKAVVDAGWAPATWMVGQTGKKISPQLYIAVGISGAIQHMAGVSGARSVVAINTDADAPIMGNSDLGLVGDWREVLPRFISALASVL